MRCARGDQPIRFLFSQPTVALHFAGKQSDLGDGVDPLPFVLSHTQQTSDERQATIDRRRRSSALQLSLAEAPNHVASDLVERQMPEKGIQLPTNLALLLDAAQARLDREIPDHGLLPGALRLDAEERLTVRLVL